MASSRSPSPARRSPGTPACRPTGASTTRRWCATSFAANFWKCCAAGSISMSRFRPGSRPRDWPIGWTNSSPTGSPRTPSSIAACWPRPTPGGSARAAAASPPPTRSTIASPICARRRGSARISTRSSIRRRWACASPTACSSPPRRRAWACRWRSRSCSSTIARPTSTAPAPAAGGPCSIADPRALARALEGWG